MKYSATAFHSKEILEISWECHEAARLAHLSLALQQKHTDTIFDSIVKANAFDVLIDWSIMVNGKRFPRSIHQKSIEICKTHHKIEALTYIIKYHRFLQEELNYILAQENSLRSLAIFTDFSDPHPELKLHDKLLQKRYQNHTHEMDLTQFSGKIYHVINEALKTEDSLFALEMVLFIFKRHHILPGELSNLADFIKTQTDEDALWISLRVAKLTNTKVDTEFLKDSKNQYLMREVYSINQTIPTDEIHGEILWVAAELNIQPKNVDFLYSYLTHPTLRIPATQLLSHTSEAMSLA